MNDKEKLTKILTEINPDIDYGKEKKLVEDGFFDSLEIMSIVTEVSEKFHIEIDPEDIITENFNSLEMMLKVIEKNRKKGE